LATPGTQLDRRTLFLQQTLEIVRQLLSELSSPRAIEELDRRGPAAHLERELGLGSLERVELMVRLDEAFRVRLPDAAVAEADTISDLVDAVLRLEPEAQEDGASARYSPANVETAPAQRAAPGRGMEAAATLVEVLRLRGTRDAARPHIHLYEDDGKVRTITCGELLDRARAAAAGLIRCGLEPGGTVAIMLPTCAEFFSTFFGVQIAGGIPVPIYPPFRADRIEEYAARQAGILQNAEAQLLVTFREAAGVARLLEPRVPSLRAVVNVARLAEAPADAPGTPGVAGRTIEPGGHRARGEDIAFLQYTSGSTGDPKGVVLTHANLLANIRAIGEGIAFQPDDVAVTWLPLYHDMGLIGAWLVPLYFGIPTAVLSPLAFLSRPERWLWAIHHHRGTLSPAPNFAYELCVRKVADRELEGLDLSSWRAALNGSEPVNPETLDRFAARFAPYGFRREALLGVYGLAENSLAVAAPPVGSGSITDRIERAAFESEGRAIPGDASSGLAFVSAGRPLPGVEVRIVDAEGREVAERIQGRLWFRGPSATSGYYRNPEATRALLQPDSFVDSGDLAYRASGELYITGRAKDIIIKAGRNIYPQEVEEIAGRVAGVRTGCVVAFGAPDERSGTERLVIAAEVRDPSRRAAIAAEITQQVATALGLPPDVVEPLLPHSIPKTSSGKLRRAETRRLFLAGRLGRKQAPLWMQVARLGARGVGPRLVSLARKGLRRTVEIFYGVYALGMLMIHFAMLWLFVQLTPNRRTAARILRRICGLFLAAARISVRVEGGELLDEWAPSGPWIFAPNHSSYLDIVVTMALLPAGVRFVAKGEVDSMPIIRTVVRRTGQFSFDRSSAQARLEQSNAVAQALGRGESVVVYPEGTFTPARGVRPFQLGAFKASLDTGRPICPVSVRGAREILRDGTVMPHWGRITVTIGPLIAPGSKENGWQEIVRLRDATRDVIARHTGEPLL
jgi:fatty-acyl-CoA synthase